MIIIGPIFERDGRYTMYISYHSDIRLLERYGVNERYSVVSFYRYSIVAFRTANLEPSCYLGFNLSIEINGVVL